MGKVLTAKWRVQLRFNVSIAIVNAFLWIAEHLTALDLLKITTRASIGESGESFEGWTRARESSLDPRVINSSTI